MSKQKKFGLVFEEHIPECTPLYGIEIKHGSTVSKKAGVINDVYRVIKITGDEAACVRLASGEKETIALSELVPVAKFGEPIYPTLQPIDRVENAPDDGLWHILIEADNYHALQLLEYLYPKQVDCIYIDPPYNTGARDWKYNNDYVDSSDSYRHSKWLSMMQKRLKIAKRILNPNNSVLIVTIDEKEYLHLGCLLEEMFPEANIQMVTDVTNPKGVSRGSLFSRAEEYIYFVFVGSASINLGSTDMLRSNEQKSSDVRWASLQRSGSNSRRFERPNLFYPIFFDKETDKFVTVGETMSLNEDRKKVVVPDGLRVAFPLGRNDDERTWQLQQETFMSLFEKGYVKFGNWQSNEKRTISYLSSGLIKQIENGELHIKSYSEDGTVVLDGDSKAKPLSVWNKSSHSASDQGSSLISNILSGKRFTFPKSLYATHDALWFFVADKPNALVVDFFAGSGTTLHAVNLLNAEDGGHRRCIMVTNNEVSSDEAKTLTAKGYQPGDSEWEKLGIARYVTWPRTVCSIEGHDVTGAPLKGDYL
ncbi:MAG: site-specific DNA-methyltransferase, partial [Trichococcus flocculiformis]